MSYSSSCHHHFHHLEKCVCERERESPAEGQMIEMFAMSPFIDCACMCVCDR